MCMNLNHPETWKSTLVTQKCEELDNLKRYNNKLNFNDNILGEKIIFHNEHCCWMFGKLATALIKTCIRENIQRGIHILGICSRP